MPSDLQVTNIKDQANANSAITIASDGQITVNQNNPTITLGSNATFPIGKLINSAFYHVNTGTAHTTTSTTNEAALNYIEFNCTTGNTIFFGYNFYAYLTRDSGTINQRYARFQLYQRAKTDSSDTRPAEGDTTNLGSFLWNSVFGSVLPSTSTSSAQQYAPFFGSASFLATANTHFLGLVFDSEVSGILVEIARSSSAPVTCFAMEFQGDVHTTGAIP